MRIDPILTMRATRPGLLGPVCAALLVVLAVTVAACVPAARAAPPALTLAVAPDTVVAGSPVTVTAHIEVPGAALALSRRRAGETAFSVVRTGLSAADGSVSWALTPPRTTTYRVDFAGDGTREAAAAETTVSVRPRLTLGAPAAVYEGQTAAFLAQVAPAHPGATVLLQRRVDGVWTAWQTLTLDAASRATARWRGYALGASTFRLAMVADADHLDGASAQRVVAVQEPNPYNVPIEAAHVIVVDKSQYRLHYYEYGRMVRAFDCVLGKPSTPTPLGHFRIYARDAHMSGAYGPRRMRYLGLYAIHGTNEPWLLQRFPRAYSHGCTRLADADIRWLFAHCDVGTRVWNVR